MPKLSIVAVLCFICHTACSQNLAFTRYFDSSWSPAPKASAVYYTEFTKHDTLYQCISYWMDSKIIYAKSYYADTSFLQPRGKQIKYYQSGVVQDSTIYNDTGKIIYTAHYYPKGALWARYIYDERANKETTEGFDVHGNIIKGFVFMREAEFPGGTKAWMQFVSNKIRKKPSKKNTPPSGIYEVIIRFIVDIEGNVTDTRAMTDLGYGLEEEAMSVINKSPRWIPAIYLNNPVNAYRMQPVVFVFEP